MIIARRPCMLIPHEERAKAEFTEDACKACGVCLQLGCPAIGKVEVEINGKARYMPVIDRSLCQGCAVCIEVCAFGALEAMRK